MISFILKTIIALFAFLTWVYSGSSYQEGLFIALIFWGVLLLAPIPYQHKALREELLEKERQNRYKIKELHELKRYERKEMERDKQHREAMALRKQMR